MNITAAAAASTSHGVSSFALKMVAIVGMTLNHFGNIFYEHLSFEALCICIGAGGLTFPIMAFLLVEGYLKTSNIKKYAMRLTIFAAISQIPFSLFLAPRANVLFTLLLGLALLYLYDHLENRVAFWMIFVLGAVVSIFCDWGFIGVVMTLMFKTMRGQRGGVAAPVMLAVLGIGLPALNALVSSGNIGYLPELLYPLVGCTLTWPLLANYRGYRGRSLKYFFYAYYPAHIAILGVTYLLLFGEMNLGL